MKRIILFSVITFLASAITQTHAQEYKVPVQNSPDTKLEINNFTGELLVEGYSGSEIILTSGSGEIKIPERANGLTRIYPGGTDNTGLGVESEKDRNVITFSCQLPISRMGDYTVKVPDKVSIQITSGCERSNRITVRNMKSEIEVQNCHGIDLENVTGPLILSTISGDINVSTDEIAPDRPFSINSISGEINITIPVKTRANIELSTITGSFYSDFDLSSTENEMKRYGGNKLNYSLNGGGSKFSISSISGNIYLRKGN